MIHFFITILVLVLLGGIVLFVWKRQVDRQIAEAGEVEWEFIQANEPDFIAHLDKPAFQKVFTKAHFPRFPIYAYACLSSFLLSLPITFSMLYFGVWTAGRFGWLPEPGDIATRIKIDPDKLRVISQSITDRDVQIGLMEYIQNVSGFYYFFGVLAMWLGIVFLFTRHYHKNRPGYLRDEIIRSR